MGVLGEHLAVDVDRLGIFADLPEDRGLHVPVAGIGRILRKHLFRVHQRLRRLALAMQDGSEILARRRERGRELEAAREERFRVGVAPEARGHLREHADRRDVGRILLEVGAQQALGDGDAVVDKRGPRFQQPRIADGEAQVLRIGLIGTWRIADRRKMVRQRPPGIAEVGLEFHRAPEGRHRFLAAAQRAEREAEFVVHDRVVAVRGRDRLEQRERAGRVAEPPLRRGEDQERRRMLRDGLEDLLGLLGGKGGRGREQALGVRERGRERADGILAGGRVHIFGVASAARSGWRRRIP